MEDRVGEGTEVNGKVEERWEGEIALNTNMRVKWKRGT